MRLIVDAYGGDNAPLAVLEGCAQSVKEYDIDITLTGDEKDIKKVASENNISLERMEIVNAPDKMAMDADPITVRKPDNNTSMAVGMRLLAEGKGDAFLSAGNSGAMVIGATFIVKRMKGIKRVAFAPILPNVNGCSMLIDSGANNECTPEMLRQFAIMGSAYMESVMNVQNPRVGLVNVGTEPHKGKDLQREAYEILKETPINFIGNVEGRDVPAGSCDVLVADGFSGNLVLKTYEGVAIELMKKIKSVFSKKLKNKLAGAMVLSDMKSMKKEFDYNTYGGAPVMGCSKPVFKVHGSAKATTFKNAIGLTVNFVNGNVIDKISETVEKIGAKQSESADN